MNRPSLLVWLSLLASYSLPAYAGEIVALCIGNNAYVIPEDQLDTPVNDARLMHKTLCAVPGAQAEDIVLLEDARRSQITLALRQFKARTTEAKLSLIYYSGHGVEDTPTGYDRAETFLLPVDAAIESADDLPDKAVPLRTVLEALEGNRGGARAVILDCCRSGAPGATKALSHAGKSLSTLDENVKKALGSAILPEGTLIAFAASPGRKAAAFLSETDTNSPFTHFVAEQMSTQGRDLLSIINTASTITKKRTEMRQVPHVELRGDVSLIMDYVIPASKSAEAAMATTTKPAPKLKPLAELMIDYKKAVATRADNPKPTGARSLPPGTRVGTASVLDTGSVGKVVQIKLPGEVPMKFCFCPTGSYTMGSPTNEAGRKDDENQVQVAFSQGFWMAQTEVTQAQWQSLMDTNPSEFQGAELPVDHVSWEAAQTFVEKLNEKLFLLGGWHYALPTEAQWEYACRAGTSEAYNFGGDASQLHVHANFSESTFARLTIGYKSKVEGDGEHSVVVATHTPNAWGLHDMHGNVSEWCQDWNAGKLHGGLDPVGPPAGSYRVYRGGSWGSPAEDCRSAARGSASRALRGGGPGLRPVIVPSK